MALQRNIKYDTLLTLDDFSESEYSKNTFKRIASLLENKVMEQIEQEIKNCLDFGIEDEVNEVCVLDNEKQIVIDLVHGGFEELCGITLDRFFELYNDIVKNNPEKLI